MKSLLFVAHDPGGANVIKPVIEYYAQRNDIASHCLLLGPAAERIASALPTLEYHHIASHATPNFPQERSVEPESLFAALDAIKPDCIFTATSFNSTLERLAVQFARLRGIPVVSIIDFWRGYAMRFTLDGVLSAPDVVFVADGRMKHEAEVELPATTRVVISGNPHLATIGAKYVETRQNAASQVRAPLLRIRFFCENIRHYYPEKPVNEFSVVPKLLQSLIQCGFHGEFIIRPHPMESRDIWEEEIANYEVGITRGGKRFAAKPAIAVRLDTATFDEVLRDNCAAVGFNSMALLETASVGIPTFSYQIAVPSDYFLVPFEEYGIVRLAREEDILQLVNSSPLYISNNNQETSAASALDLIDQVLQQFLTK